ncbi:MAG TPA: DUF1614 domain-containing protein [Firmicutes bacterium]|nr:DUF1614 domain-containing protein [Bacillota bacterium]
MPTGLIVLVAITVLVYFGLLQRVLDRMHLTDKEALFFLALMILGAYINIPLWRRPSLTINVGGGLVPIILAGYVMSRVGTVQEWQRAVLATIITAIGIYTAGRLLPSEPGTMILDPTYLYALLGGTVAYLSGRSRRGAFIAGMLGVILSDLGHFVRLVMLRLPGRTVIGGAGAYDTVILSGMLAVSLAEIVGETREKLAGGSREEVFEHRLRRINAADKNKGDTRKGEGNG